jgi:hypothetical protein
MFRWTADPFPAFMRIIEDRRMIASALLIRNLLCGRIDSPHFLASKLQFEQRAVFSGRHANANHCRSSIAQIMKIRIFEPLFQQLLRKKSLDVPRNC